MKMKVLKNTSEILAAPHLDQKSETGIGKNNLLNGAESVLRIKQPLS
jgi:hypothetical protein